MPGQYSTLWSGSAVEPLRSHRGECSPPVLLEPQMGPGGRRRWGEGLKNGLRMKFSTVEKVRTPSDMVLDNNCKTTMFFRNKAILTAGMFSVRLPSLPSACGPHPIRICPSLVSAIYPALLSAVYPALLSAYSLDSYQHIPP